MILRTTFFVAAVGSLLLGATHCRPADKPVYANDAEVRFFGSVMYNSAGCASCHGVLFDGHGSDTAELSARGIVTPGFRDAEIPPARTPNDFFKTITVGSERLPSHAFQSYTDRGRWAMAYFLYAMTKQPVGAAAAERNAALAAAASETRTAYAASRRWEMGYKPIGERPASPDLQSMLGAANPVDQGSAGAVDQARRDSAAQLADHPAAEVYARNCSGCHGAFGEGRGAAQRFGLYSCKADGRLCGAYLSTADLRSAPGAASLASFRGAHADSNALHVSGMDSWTEDEWNDLYSYVRGLTGRE
ncbi:MAG: cytochrome c [Leptospirales bacterium]|nr:cytochrome c [Leptospirales bacterium]